jgi:broad specificity phosphatase PhoE
MYLVGGGATLALGQTDQETLRTLERLKFEAQQSKDNSALNAILDDAALVADHDGTLRNKSEYLAGLRLSDATLHRLSPESLNVIVFEQTAIVVGIYDEKGIEANHPYHRRCRFIDTWVFKHGRWICIASTATSTVR